MAEPAARARTRITVPRVEFDLGALFVGMVGVFGYELLWRLLAPAYSIQESFAVKVMQPGGPQDAQLPGHRALKAAFFDRLTELFRLPYLDRLLEQVGGGLPGVFVPAADGRLAPFRYPLPWWQVGATAVALLVLWSVVGGALARTHAMRIARDESISWDDGFAFSFSNLKAFLTAPLFALAAVALFAAAVAAIGALGAIPWAGAILNVVLLPLAMLAGLVLTIVALGALFGFPLFHGALATERNGMLDAVSRTYSYAFTRPVTYIVGGALVFAIGAVISMLGGWFLQVATLWVMQLGASWSEAGATTLRDGFVAAAQFGMPGDLSELSTPQKISVWTAFVWFAIAWLAVRGFVLSYVVGGLTDLYFLLREEVDGTPRNEIYTGEEEDLDLGDPVPDEPSTPHASEEPTAAGPGAPENASPPAPPRPSEDGAAST